MKENVIKTIIAAVEEGNRTAGQQPIWQKPILGFADARDPLFGELKKAVRSTHALPENLLPGARTVIAYFLPFDRAIGRSNHRGEFGSDAWAQAYVETNRLIATINEKINDLLETEGFSGTRLPATHNFDKEQLMSDWSHKHVAFIAGLGSFGRHHMLITDKGCCGRIGSVVTDSTIPATPRSGQERCLFKADGSCGKCLERCPILALKDDAYDRHACYDRLMENASMYERYGLADVCGKCAAIVPCSFCDPVKRAAG